MDINMRYKYANINYICAIINIYILLWKLSRNQYYIPHSFYENDTRHLFLYCIHSRLYYKLRILPKSYACHYCSFNDESTIGRDIMRILSSWSKWFSCNEVLPFWYAMEYDVNDWTTKPKFNTQIVSAPMHDVFHF